MPFRERGWCPATKTSKKTPIFSSWPECVRSEISEDDARERLWTTTCTVIEGIAHAKI